MYVNSCKLVDRSDKRYVQICTANFLVLYSAMKTLADKEF